jgi:hypothetical protein
VPKHMYVPIRLTFNLSTHCVFMKIYLIRRISGKVAVGLVKIVL